MTKAAAGASPDSSAEDVKRLQRCIGDLGRLLAPPPGSSTGSSTDAGTGRGTAGEPSRMVGTLADALLGMLDLDLVYVRLLDSDIVPALELRRTPPSSEAGTALVKIGERDRLAVSDDLDAELSLATAVLGLRGDLGTLVAGSRRPAFPTDTDMVVLKVAASQAALRLHEARRAGEFECRLIMDTIPGLVAIMTPTGDIRAVNSQVLEYCGRTLAQLRQWGSDDTVHLDDRPGVSETFSHSIAEGIPYDFEARIRRFDGVYRWFQVRGLPLRDANDTIVCWYVLLNDIDERKRAEEALKRSEAFLVEGQRLTRMGTFSWCLPGDEIMWSHQVYCIFGFDFDEAVTFDRMRTRFHPEDLPFLNDMIDQARRGVSDLEYEHRLLMPDGSTKYVQLIAHGTRDESGQLEYIGAVQDVTQRRASEEALTRARSELAHVARVLSLGVLTASIAHEVNQPLAGIVTNAGTCLRMLAADPPNLEGARETARRTIRDGNRAAEVIKRLRALFSKQDPTNEAVDLNEATREVIALSSSRLQSNRINLALDLADDLPRVTGDRVQLQQVMLNLLGNAIDAMSTIEDRPRHLLVRTGRGSQDDGGHVHVAVQDSGVGFDPAIANQLFDAFYTTKHDGMGIGLSVSRSIIERHHGHLWATRNDGPGATFAFSIPRVPQGVIEAA